MRPFWPGAELRQQPTLGLAAVARSGTPREGARESSRRFSAGAPDALAPSPPVSTTFCLYLPGHVVAKARYRGGPFDAALNGSDARFPRGTACAGIATLPSVVVFTYSSTIRYVVLDVGGCVLITSTGTRRVLIGRGDGALLQAYGRAVDNAARHRRRTNADKGNQAPE